MNTEIFNLSEYLQDKKEILEEHLNKIIMRCDERRELVQAMKYSLMAGGKRLRPVLAMASAEAVGEDFRITLPAACAIEMIHTYSLIHDDLPAMDNDDLRRGVPTCHKAFSEATAILAGDALLTHAFTILSKPEQIFLESKFGKQPVFRMIPDKATLLELISIISEAAGVDGMVEGQMMDMLAVKDAIRPALQMPAKASIRPPALQLDYLKKLHHLKTGKMIIASVQSGAVSAGAEPELLKILTRYAEKIGLAFQVTDDILNVEGDPAIMGKSAGSDKLNDKLTFPALLGLDESKKFASNLVGEAVDALSMLPLDFQERALPLKAIAEYILKRKK
ncbi:MAG: polyprenyl synthetase family protein [Desulfamplus sp.]|nr:polyprenyl synthetase family protein [Desulfamplus sp.]